MPMNLGGATLSRFQSRNDARSEYTSGKIPTVKRTRTAGRTRSRGNIRPLVRTFKASIGFAPTRSAIPTRSSGGSTRSRGLAWPEALVVASVLQASSLEGLHEVLVVRLLLLGALLLGDLLPLGGRGVESRRGAHLTRERLVDGQVECVQISRRARDVELGESVLEVGAGGIDIGCPLVRWDRGVQAGVQLRVAEDVLTGCGVRDVAVTDLWTRH